MSERRFSEAIDEAVSAAMASDRCVVVLGEDVPMIRAPLFARFGPERVLGAPISESAFVGAAFGAAMAGLRPVVEVMLVDFIAVAMDAVLNQIAKLEAFSGGNWSCPLVIRAACGGGYGDGGQHEQSLWGMLAGIPGLKVVVPSTPADAKGLMASAIQDDGPVVFLEHKLLSEVWLEWMGRGGRENVAFDVPVEGGIGEVPDATSAVRIGEAAIRREGEHVTLVSLAVGAHRAAEAAERLAAEEISAEVIDLRSVRPLDVEALRRSAKKTGRVVVVDEDYRECGVSGEIAALLLEADLQPLYRRVCLETTLPYDRRREHAALPGVERIVAAVRAITGDQA